MALNFHNIYLAILPLLPLRLWRLCIFFSECSGRCRTIRYKFCKTALSYFPVLFTNLPTPLRTSLTIRLSLTQDGFVYYRDNSRTLSICLYLLLPYICLSLHFYSRQRLTVILIGYSSKVCTNCCSGS